MKSYKSNKQISKSANVAANKLRDIYEDSCINKDAVKLLDFVQIMKTIDLLDDFSKNLLKP